MDLFVSSLFKLLAKKHQKISETMRSTPNTPSGSIATPPTTPTATPLASPSSPSDVALDMSQFMESSVSWRVWS